MGRPVEGPPRWTSTTTTGVSIMPAMPTASVMRAKPPPEVPVMARTPAWPAPMAMFMAASSSSACLKTTPYLAARGASQCMMPEAGVMG
ncbi:MAG: hypothetical protein HYZ74_04755 [Elusimicrobia bacterium]|nr:hypothetical protein [Elusimicrobiota bacterium]